MSDEPQEIELAQREIESAKELRWTAADSDRAELGLIAEMLAIDTGTRSFPDRPALKVGQVLVAARAAVGKPAERHVSELGGREETPFFTRRMLGRATERSIAELEDRRDEIIALFRGPTIGGEYAADLSDEKEAIEVELERRTRPTDAAKQERAATLREAISLAPHEVTCTCPHGGEFDWGLHADDCARRQVGEMLDGMSKR